MDIPPRGLLTFLHFDKILSVKSCESEESEIGRGNLVKWEEWDIMNVNVFLFDDFNSMDVFGPVEVFGKLPEHFHINYWSVSGNIINSSQGAKLWTEPVDEEMENGILLIPGGRGAHRVIHHERETIELLQKLVSNADTCLMVADGSGFLAQTGVLYRRNIAEYKMNENWKRMFTAAVYWIPNVSWVADGKFYSSSSSLYGIDMALGVVADLIDIDAANKAAEAMGYTWKQELGFF